MYRRVVAWIGLLVFVVAGRGRADLAADFAAPPASVRPGCYWYWFDDQVSREGITRDLEAMKQVGIGTAMIGIIGGVNGAKATLEPKPLTDAWWGNIVHAVKEGGRLGIDIGFFNSPGWSQSGGPWVRPEQAMRYLAQTEIRVTGPRKFREKLTAPAADFQQVAVQAFPAPAGEDEVAAIVERTDTAIRFEMPASFTVRSLTICPVKLASAKVELKASDDGVQFRTVTTFTMARGTFKHGLGPVFLAPVTVSFPAATTRFFRLDFTPDPALAFSARTSLGDVRLCAAPKVDDFAGKSMIKTYEHLLPPFSTPVWPLPAEPDRPEQIIQPRRVLDLTAQTASDGTLTWDVPPGEWVVLRTGMVPTGTVNKPAPAGTTGPEVDKMNRDHLQAHFDAYVGELLKRLAPEERRAWKYVVADSYETGFQNWTDGLARDFRQHYGYDPLPFLPVLGGRPVGGADVSDRFLWDLRRLVAERIAADYVGALRELSHRNGLKLWLENYGHFGFPSEFLLYGGASDEIGGEFWMGSNLGGAEVRAAASAAHLYGKPVVWAEAFTSRNRAFRDTPRDLKAKGDWAFCQGINQFILHVYIHQPTDGKPGVNAWFGTEFNRNNTWFGESKAWIDYLRRCSVMLQTGRPVADVLRYIGEDAPRMVGPDKPELPDGYDYDCINSDGILNRLSVREGRFYLPDGTRYALLVLPDSAAMRPAVLKQLARLVAAGGTVLGSAPRRSPSLQDYPACDQEVKRLATDLWGTGRVMTGIGLGDALDRLHVLPDVVVPKDVLWKHRATADADIYFVSNQASKPRRIAVSFRDHRRHVSLWQADTGCIGQGVHRVENGRAVVDLDLDPAGSVFVVFSDKPSVGTAAPAVVAAPKRVGPLEIRRAMYEAVDGSGAGDVTERVRAALRDGALEIDATPDALGGDPVYGHAKQLKVEYAWNGVAATLVVPEAGRLALPLPPEIPGPWQVAFPTRTVTFDCLISWTDHPERDIRFHSGAATYSTTFRVGKMGSPALLDLGRVEALATVEVNGRVFHTLWKYPYKLDISAALRPGENALKVTVVNTWHNRLVGDAGLPPEQRGTVLGTWQAFKSQLPLQPAGLLGPVTVSGVE